MFNLEQSIAVWRRQMIASGIKSHDVLDELESHLREEIEQRIRAGRDKDIVVQEAIERLGRAEVLRGEFETVENKERKVMKRIVLFIAAIIGVMVGMALVMPAVAQYQHEGVMRNGEPWLFLIGSLVALAGCGAGIRGFKKSRA